MAFYDEMREAADDLLGEFAQGVVTLTQQVDSGAPIDPAKPWLGSIIDEQVYALDATVRRVAQKFVDGTLIVATDDQITFAVPAVAPTMDDTFSVDGTVRVLKDLRPIPAAGDPVAYVAFVAGILAP
ncbi:hypothetical protein [Nitratireductor sp. StC3]|uniref:hypothetical protein n=1 Tax=Nitratireductor sp. StC3 TaxID=2126741 RepID=UPI000D0CC5A9|nr:hypothetical protein [Nitratireductor sp. StC3]PSM18225.1 hypothetical protein C7T96_10160 [Nitratireductor sp. StC3]